MLLTALDAEQVALRSALVTPTGAVGACDDPRTRVASEPWWPEILAFIHTGITNAGSEGTNRVIKTVARDAYGFRNPENQRLRTRTATTRRHRGHLNPA